MRLGIPTRTSRTYDMMRRPFHRLMLVDSSTPAVTHHSGIIRGSDPAHKRGLRTVASIEFLKGILAIAVAIGLLILRNKDVWDIAEGTLEFLHIDPDLHFAQVFLDFADQVTAGELTTLATLALAYSAVRFLEAYGLWRTRIWGEWLAIFSGLVYLPFEIRALMLRSTAFRWGALIVNLALVGYVAYVRASEIYRLRQGRQRRREELSHPLSTPDGRWSRSG
ncbi:MAG: DUF2127 domain-containing protein [Acidobacteria bacterium]|nr:DUF2127 domain-containing protein [Acidobacteriota bacterium]